MKCCRCKKELVWMKSYGHDYWVWESGSFQWCGAAPTRLDCKPAVLGVWDDRGGTVKNLVDMDALKRTVAIAKAQKAGYLVVKDERMSGSRRWMGVDFTTEYLEEMALRKGCLVVTDERPNRGDSVICFPRERAAKMAGYLRVWDEERWRGRRRIARAAWGLNGEHDLQDLRGGFARHHAKHRFELVVTDERVGR